MRLVAFLLLLRPLWLEAGACCTSAAAFGLGRLLAHEQGALGFSVSMPRLSLEPFLIYRLLEPLQIYGKLGLLNDKNLLGFSHQTLGARYEWSSLGDPYVPAISFYTSLAIPLGHPLGNKHPLSDLSRFWLSQSVVLEQIFGSYYAQWGVGVLLPSPKPVLGKPHWLGLHVQTYFAFGTQITPWLIISLLPEGRFQAYSGGYGFRLGGSLVFKLSPQLMLHTQVSQDLFTQNLPFLTTLGAGLRHSF